MTVVVCIDDQMGMTFYGRRQSRDRVVIGDILDTVRKDEGARLLITPFSAKLFGEGDAVVCDDPFADAEDNDVIFIEDIPFPSQDKRVDRAVLYRWNRSYPYDKKLDTPPDQCGFKLVECCELEGYSHPLITKEVYLR